MPSRTTANKTKPLEALQNLQNLLRQNYIQHLVNLEAGSAEKKADDKMQGI